MCMCTQETTEVHVRAWRRILQRCKRMHWHSVPCHKSKKTQEIQIRKAIRLFHKCSYISWECNANEYIHSVSESLQGARNNARPQPVGGANGHTFGPLLPVNVPIASAEAQIIGLMLLVPVLVPVPVPAWPQTWPGVPPWCPEPPPKWLQ